MSHKVDSLRAKLGDIVEEVKVIEADAAGGGFTPIQQADISKLQAQFDEVESQIKAAEMIERASTPQPSKTQPAPVGGNFGAYGQASYTSQPARGVTTISRGPSNGTGGFRSPGDFFAAVRGASAGQVDSRLMNAITTYGNEGGPGGQDGGFAVPSDWRREIMEIVAGEGTLIDQLNPITTPSNSVILPVDEASPHATTGITAEWTGEAAAITTSKPLLKQVTINLNKVAGLVHLSDELIEDNPATGAYALRILGRKIRSVVEEALVAGSGLAKPLGFLNAPALVTQVKSATGSTNIAAADLTNMASRMVPGSFGNAFWLCHSSVLSKLWTLVLGQQPILAPDFSKSPFGTLLGRPVFTSEFCSDYNTAGDIFLVSPDGYGLAVKSSGVRTDTSIHFGFDQGLQSFRATLRIGGTPLLSTPVARKNGTSTQSHLICLGVRA
jgi:HK97 family phage major capsid protein